MCICAVNCNVILNVLHHYKQHLGICLSKLSLNIAQSFLVFNSLTINIDLLPCKANILTQTVIRTLSSQITLLLLEYWSHLCLIQNPSPHEFSAVPRRLTPYHRNDSFPLQLTTLVYPRVHHPIPISSQPDIVKGFHCVTHKAESFNSVSSFLPTPVSPIVFWTKNFIIELRALNIMYSHRSIPSSICP